MQTLIDLLLHFVDQMGLVGVYFYMFLVGTFIPVPSELVLLPAGYLASQEKRSLLQLVLAGSLGSISGAMFNYYFARFIIKKILKNKRKTLATVIRFFKRHGKISVFVAPLTPGLGQYISLPAGIAHMKLRYFLPITYSANLIWVSFMLLIGFMFGDNASKSHTMVVYGSLSLLGAVILIAIVYVLIQVRKDKRAHK